MRRSPRVHTAPGAFRCHPSRIPTLLQPVIPGLPSWVYYPAPPGYEDVQQLNRLSLTAPDGSITTYGYDSLNRVYDIASSWAGSFGFGYDALSRRTSLSRPNGVNTTYTYDSVSRLLSVLHQAGGTTLDGASYTYDAAGNRTSKTNYLNGISDNYIYDALYQLQQVTEGTSTTESYTYDPVGNRLSSLSVPQYSYNTSNELTSTSLASYSYDHNGNTLTKTDSTGTTQYAWDYENRLTQVSVPQSGGGSTVVSFKYDPFGRRIQKSVVSATTNYLYDGLNVIEDLDNTGNVLARYTHGTVTDETLSMLRGGMTSYYHADGLGSMTSLSNSAGTLAQTYTYDSFGKLSASTGTLTNSFQYTGREFDPEMGIYEYRARYLDQNTGRFLSEDPLGFGSDVNFYPYVGNSPTSFTDPSGKSAAAAVALVPALAGGVSGAEVGSSMAGPIGGLVGLNVGLLINDVSGAYDLGVAYGWWEQSQPDSKQKSCKKKSPDDCLDRYLREKAFCSQNYWGTRYYGQCRDRAFWRYSNCQKGEPDPGPLDPLDPNWSNK